MKLTLTLEALIVTSMIGEYCTQVLIRNALVNPLFHSSYKCHGSCTQGQKKHRRDSWLTGPLSRCISYKVYRDLERFKVEYKGCKVASYPGPLLILLVEGLVCENTLSDVTFDQCGCVHRNAPFHRDIVPECPWPSSSLVQVL